jgi:hypothetical protein
MLIVEGPDNAGKSTLIHQLEIAHDIRSVHAGGPPKSKEEINTKRTVAYENCFKRIIQDRNYFISDLVYGNVLRRAPNYENFSILLELLSTRPLIIYCRPSLEHLLKIDDHEVKAHETQEHVDAVKKNQRLIVEHYDELMKVISSKTTVIEYDFEKGFSEDDLFEIREFLNKDKCFL